MRERPGQEIEGGEEKDFSIVREKIIDFFQHELRRAQNFGVFDKQSMEARQQRIDYLEGLINFLKSEQLLPVKEYFDRLIEVKERVAVKIAEGLRKEIVVAKPKIDRLNKESARLAERLEIEKRKGNTKRIQAILKEIGNIDNDIAAIAQRQGKVREDLRRVQDDPDLEKFRNFVLMIDRRLKGDGIRV
jgi:response regulator RpfG family c-di-GMP phosphodiesterase